MSESEIETVALPEVLEEDELARPILYKSSAAKENMILSKVV